jgi:FixJ family two-component response regulator
VSDTAPVVDLIEDSGRLVTDLREALLSMGVRLRTHSTVQQFLTHYDPADAGCLVCSVRLPGTWGRRVLEHLNFIDAITPVVMVGDSMDMAVAVDALQLGAFDFLELPLNPTRLAECVQRAIEHDSLQRQEMSLLARARPATMSRRLH